MTHAASPPAPAPGGRTAGRLLGLLALLPVALLAPAGMARAATTPSDVADALRRDPVFVEADAEAAGRVDVAAVRAQVAASPRTIYVAVLPQRAAAALGSAPAVAVAVARRVAGPAVVVALVGDAVAAASTAGTGLAPGQADALVRGAGGGPTERLVAAVRALQQVRVGAAGPAGGGSSGAGSGGSPGGGGGSGALLVGGLAVLAVAGGGLYLRQSRLRRRRELEGQRADVESLYNRLGSDVSTLSAGDDPLVRQALADAAERYTATGALLATADTPGELSAARRTAVEGLAATRTARVKLGLDPGPEVPPPPGAGPQLTQAQTVQVGDQEYEGSPSYEPGRGHYFGGGYYGGRYVPGGWYAVPFWETMLLTSVLSGGFGGGFGGGGGFERGYEAGRDDAADDRRDAGWGGDSGGDTGGWGGGWGGGDTGGGWGGDVGGGDTGGGGDGGW